MASTNTINLEEGKGQLSINGYQFTVKTISFENNNNVTPNAAIHRTYNNRNGVKDRTFSAEIELTKEEASQIMQFIQEDTEGEINYVNTDANTSILLTNALLTGDSINLSGSDGGSVTVNGIYQDRILA